MLGYMCAYHPLLFFCFSSTLLENESMDTCLFFYLSPFQSYIWSPPPQIIGFEVGGASENVCYILASPLPPHLFFGTVVCLLSQSFLGMLWILPGYSPVQRQILGGGTAVECSSRDSVGIPGGDPPLNVIPIFAWRGVSLHVYPPKQNVSYTLRGPPPARGRW